MPPWRSISWKMSQAFSATWSVSQSRYQLPPAGSITRCRWASSCRMRTVLRAMRRLKASGRPSTASNGTDVIASAPPTPAAKQPTVFRSRFTYGSRSGQHALADPGVNPHRAGRRRAAARLDDPRPQPAGGPQLGDGQEVMRAQADAEQDLPGGGVDVQPGRRHRPQVLDAGGHAEGDVLGRGRAGVVIGRGADADGGDVRIVLRRPRRQVGHHAPAPRRGGQRQLAVAGQHRQRIGVERAASLIAANSASLPQRDEQRRPRQKRRAGFQRHADHVQVDAGQARVEVVDVVGHHPVAAGQFGRRRDRRGRGRCGRRVEPQQERGDAALRDRRGSPGW